MPTWVPEELLGPFTFTCNLGNASVANVTSGWSLASGSSWNSSFAYTETSFALDTGLNFAWLRWTYGASESYVTLQSVFTDIPAVNTVNRYIINIGWSFNTQHAAQTAPASAIGMSVSDTYRYTGSLGINYANGELYSTSIGGTTALLNANNFGGDQTANIYATQSLSSSATVAFTLGTLPLSELGNLIPFVRAGTAYRHGTIIDGDYDDWFDLGWDDASGYPDQAPPHGLNWTPPGMGMGGTLAFGTPSAVTVTYYEIVPGYWIPDEEIPCGENVEIRTHSTSIPTDGQHNGLKPAHRDGKLYYWYCGRTFTPGTNAHWEYERVYANVQSTMTTTANGFFAERFGADSWTERIEMNSLVYSANGMFAGGWPQYLFYWNAFNQLYGYWTQTGNIALPTGFDTTNAYVYSIRMISAMNLHQEDVYDATYSFEGLQQVSNHSAQITYPAANLIIGPLQPYQGNVNISGSLNEPGHYIREVLYEPVTVNTVASLIGSQGLGSFYYTNGASFSGGIAAANIESLVFSRTTFAGHQQQLRKSGSTELPSWTPSSWYEAISPWFELRVQRWIGETTGGWNDIYTNVVRGFNGVTDQVQWEVPNTIVINGVTYPFTNNQVTPFFIDWSYDEEACYLLVAYDGAVSATGPYAVWRITWNEGTASVHGLPFCQESLTLANTYKTTPASILVRDGAVYVGGTKGVGAHPVILTLPTSANTGDTWDISYQDFLGTGTIETFTGTYDSTHAYAGARMSANSYVLVSTSPDYWGRALTYTGPDRVVGIYGRDHRAFFCSSATGTIQHSFWYTNDGGTTWELLCNRTDDIRPTGGIEWRDWVLFQVENRETTPETMLMGALIEAPNDHVSAVEFITDINQVNPLKTMDWGGPWIGFVDSTKGFIQPTTGRISFAEMVSPAVLMPPTGTFRLQPNSFVSSSGVFKAGQLTPTAQDFMDLVGWTEPPLVGYPLVWAPGTTTNNAHIRYAFDENTSIGINVWGPGTPSESIPTTWSPVPLSIIPANFRITSLYIYLTGIGSAANGSDEYVQWDAGHEVISGPGGITVWPELTFPTLSEVIANGCAVRFVVASELASTSMQAWRGGALYVYGTYELV